MRIVLKTLAWGLLTSIALQAKAQNEETAVKMAVENLFKAMKTADSAGVVNAFSEGAILQTIKIKEGSTEVKHEAIADFASFVAKQQGGDADEQIGFETIKIDGSLASVWTPYTFYYKGKFSHCGVNSFQLVKLNGQWKIQYLIDTRRKDGCKR